MPPDGSKGIATCLCELRASAWDNKKICVSGTPVLLLKDIPSQRITYPMMQRAHRNVKNSFTKVSCLQPKKILSTIYANTPWQVFQSPSGICQRGLAGFLSSDERLENEITALYTITFLPPGMFLYFHLYMLINKISSKKRSKPNHSFSADKPYKRFSPREEKILSSRG